uniref:Uncharacterized protein n=1 Tax=uncultured bacterium fosmid pJB39A3 TaxID=1478063 RepID=A0A0H3U7S5_9BACT|nr:hypothetical protein [uncultured bacterium fosmid pJB39A3]
MENAKEVRKIMPMSSIDFGEIAAKWNDKFNRDISNRSDQWRLMAYPVMPGKQTTRVALVFEQEIRVNEPECTSLYKYRVLLYDMTVEPVLINSSEFQFKDWRVYTAWFLKGQLYVTMVDEDKRFDVIKICGEGNEKVLSLGRFVTDVSVTTRGDIVVGYDCCADDDDNREPLIMFERGKGSKSLESPDAITCEAACIDSNDNIWAYVKPYNAICHMEGDKYETFPIKLNGFTGIGVSDDGKLLLGSIGYKYYGTRLYAFRRNEEDIFSEGIEVVLDTGEEEDEDADAGENESGGSRTVDRKVVSAAFAGNKAVFRKGSKLYMCNINELEMVVQEDESDVKKESE